MKHVYPPVITFKLRPKVLRHRLFGHGDHIGNCGVLWDYEKHQPQGIAWFCYDCGASFIKPWDGYPYQEPSGASYEDKALQRLHPRRQTKARTMAGAKVHNPSPRRR